MGLAARDNRWHRISEFFGLRLVALAPPARLGDGLLEELHNVLRQAEVWEDIGVVGDVHVGWRASQQTRKPGTHINKSGLGQWTQYSCKF